MWFGVLGASLSENMLTGKGILRAGYRDKEGKVILSVGCESKGSSIKDFLFKKFFLTLPNPLTNFEIQKYYKSEWRFNWIKSFKMSIRCKKITLF